MEGRQNNGLYENHKKLIGIINYCGEKSLTQEEILERINEFFEEIDAQILGNINEVTYETFKLLSNGLEIFDTLRKITDIFYELEELEKPEKTKDRLYKKNRTKQIITIPLELKLQVFANLGDENGNTLLHHAAKYKNIAGKIISELLLKSGANPNAENQHRETPLHTAVKNANYETSKMLIESGADVDKYSKNNVTLLEIAVKTRNNEELIRLLRKSSKHYLSDEKLAEFTEGVRNTLVKPINEIIERSTRATTQRPTPKKLARKIMN